MNNEEQQFLNDLDSRLWNAADRLRSNVNPSDYKPDDIAKLARLTAALSEQFKESARLEAAIRSNLAGLGYDV
jgi:hypothetical protein